MIRNQTILYVDDDPSLLRLLSMKLVGKNYAVVSLDDPKQASEKLVRTGVQAAITRSTVGSRSWTT